MLGYLQVLYDYARILVHNIMERQNITCAVTRYAYVQNVTRVSRHISREQEYLARKTGQNICTRTHCNTVHRTCNRGLTWWCQCRVAVGLQIYMTISTACVLYMYRGLISSLFPMNVAAGRFVASTTNTYMLYVYGVLVSNYATFKFLDNLFKFCIRDYDVLACGLYIYSIT
jgi:hypothetical protein